MKTKPYRRIRTFLAVMLAFLIFLFAVGTFFLVASLTVDGSARYVPDSAKRVDLAPLFEKGRENWTDEDYQTVSRQTGILLKEAIDEESDDRLLEFQNALFYRGELTHELVVFPALHDILCDPETGKPFYAPIVNVQPGDIVLTSTCHTLGWRNGHATIVLENGLMLQSVSPGYNSEISSLSAGNALPWFREATNFMVLRLKDADAATRSAIAKGAEEHLAGIPYSLTVGIFSAKDQGLKPSATNCSHLVWQAYRYAGYDIDSDGGPVCTARDIANSRYLEVVQMYGFDLDKGW